MSSELVIKDLFVNVDGKPILQGVNLTIRQGDIILVPVTNKLYLP